MHRENARRCGEADFIELRESQKRFKTLQRENRAGAQRQRLSQRPLIYESAEMVQMCCALTNLIHFG
jgi:hypothetical protein